MEIRKSFLVGSSLAAMVFSFLPVSASGVGAATITAGSNVSGATNQDISLSGAFTLNGFDSASTFRATVTAADGLLVRSSTPLTCSTPSGFPGSGSSGSTVACVGSPTEITAFLDTLSWRSPSDVENSSITLRMSPDQQGYFGGHVYEFVTATADWSGAKAAAAAKSFTDDASVAVPGYLATITSQAENDFIFSLVKSDAWLGGSDHPDQINPLLGTSYSFSELNNKFYWVTGPEAGTQYSGTGAPIGSFSNWSSGEPNDSSGEYYAEFYNGNGKWNDLDGTFLLGYVVEYGASTPISSSRFASASISATARSATKPGAPTMARVTSKNKKVQLSWTAPSDGGSPILGYRVEYSTSLTLPNWTASTRGCAPLLTESSTAQVCDLTGLQNWTLYYFRVAAINLIGRGDWSSPTDPNGSATPVKPGR